jgi:hypothetical protein
MLGLIIPSLGASLGSALMVMSASWMIFGVWLWLRNPKGVDQGNTSEKIKSWNRVYIPLVVSLIPFNFLHLISSHSQAPKHSNKQLKTTAPISFHQNTPSPNQTTSSKKQ